MTVDNLKHLPACRLFTFLTIPHNAGLPKTSGEHVDLFIGKDRDVRLTFNNGTETKFRDVIVLGRLLLQSSDPNIEAIKPRLVVRGVISAGGIIQGENIDLIHGNPLVFKQYNIIETTRRELRDSLYKLLLEKINSKRFTPIAIINPNTVTDQDDSCEGLVAKIIGMIQPLFDRHNIHLQGPVRFNGKIVNLEPQTQLITREDKDPTRMVSELHIHMITRTHKFDLAFNEEENLKVQNITRTSWCEYFKLLKDFIPSDQLKFITRAALVAVLGIGCYFLFTRQT